MALTQRVGKWWEKKDDEVAHIILVCSYDLEIVCTQQVPVNY